MPHVVDRLGPVASAAIVSTPTSSSAARSALRDTGDVDERVRLPPGLLTRDLELAERAVVTRFGTGVGLSRFGGEHLAELDAETIPVGTDILVADDLGVARAERDLQVRGAVRR